MKCVCGSIVKITNDNLVNLNNNFVIICKNCNRAYIETDFSEREIERTYWDQRPTEVK